MAPTYLRQERKFTIFQHPACNPWQCMLKGKYYPKIFNQFFLFGCNFCQRKTTAMFLPIKLISCILRDARSCIQNLCVNNWTLCRPVTKTSEGIFSYDLQEIKKRKRDEVRKEEEREGLRRENRRFPPSLIHQKPLSSRDKLTAFWRTLRRWRCVSVNQLQMVIFNSET